MLTLSVNNRSTTTSSIQHLHRLKVCLTCFKFLSTAVSHCCVVSSEKMFLFVETDGQVRYHIQCMCVCVLSGRGRPRGSIGRGRGAGGTVKVASARPGTENVQLWL